MAEELRHERFTRPDGRERSGDDRRGVPAGERSTSLYWLFLVPFVALFIPWIFNSSSPELFGIPFFYWYQLAWVPLTVCLTVVVYRATRGRS